MAYDAVRRQVVVFGGINGQQWFGDTWVWDGALWTQVAETGPQGRSRHAMAYDEARQHVVLFGGQAGEELADTWVWDGTGWTQVAEVGPPARHGHGLTFDPPRARVVLFGGATADGVLGDTWEWDGEAWTQRDEAGPGDRLGHAMAYDATRGRVVVFGGASLQQVWDDTWEWNGVVWKQTAEFGAPATFDAAMVYNGRWSLLFGGAGAMAPGEPGRDVTWEWDGRRWTAVSQFGPSPRSGTALAFDHHRRRIVLFGGCAEVASQSPSSYFGDSWECPGREPLFASLTVLPATVDLGDTFKVTVGLSEPIGSDFSLQLGSTVAGHVSNLGLPPAVVVPAGEAAATATSSIPVDAAPGTHAVMATGAGVTRSATLIVNVALPGQLRIVAVLPNPVGNEVEDEAVHLRNLGPTVVPLAGWRIENGAGQAWPLDAADGEAGPGQTIIVTRQQRSMPLPNTGGTVVLMNSNGIILDVKNYGPAQSGQLIQF